MSKTAKVDVILNGEQAKAALAEIKNELKQVKEMRDKAFADQDVKGYNQLNNQYKKLTADAGKLEKQTKGVSDVLKNLSSASIRELQNALSATNREFTLMKRNDPGFEKKAAEVKKLRTALNEATDASRAHQSSWSRIADGFNKYFAVITAGAASLTGLVFSLRKTVDVANEFEKRADNLSALTGLMGRDLEYLKKQALELSTATIEGNVRITASATEILDAYTKVGSKRPDLLKVKEDLNAVTQEAMILAAAADGELQPAVDGLTMVLNQFNLPASESRRIINVLAAGSKEGAGEVDYLTAAFEKSGSVASSFGVSIEDLTGVIETLAPRMSEPEMAGRNLRNIMIKLETDANEKLHPSLVGLGQALKNLADEQLSVVEMEKMFGAENINAANILISNTAETDKYTKAVTGTNVALEQAAINTDNNATKLAQARNEIQKTYIEFGQKLAPAMTFSTNTFNAFLRVLMGAPQFVKQYNMALITLGTVLLAYNANLAKSTALKVIDFVWSKNLVAQYIRNNIVLNAMVTWEKLRAIWTTNATVATKLATSAQTAWNAVLLANPIGVVIAAIGALVLAIKGYDQYNAESIRLEREKTLAIQSVKKANDDLSVTLENQKTIISVLNRLSMDEKKAKLELFDATLKQAEAELALAKAKQLQVEKDNHRVTLWQRTKNYFLTGTDFLGQAIRNEHDAAENGKKAADEMTEVINQMEDDIKSMRANSSALSNVINAEADADSITLKTVEALQEKQRLYNDALKSYAIGSADYIRIQQKLSVVNKELSKDFSSPTGPAGSAAVLTDALDELNKKIADYNRLINNAAASGDTALVKSLLAEKKAAEDLLQTYKDLIDQVKYGIDPKAAMINIAGKGLPDDKKKNFISAINRFQGNAQGVTYTSGPSEQNQQDEANAADIRQRIIDAAISTANTINDAVFDIVKNRYDRELQLGLNNIEKLRDAELSNKHLTEKQKAAINAKYDKQSAEIKLEAFRKQQKASELQAGINGALAITKTFAEYGFTPQGLIAAGAQAVATLAEIAVISSTPPPEYYTGGFTAQAYSDYKPVGTVHANEFVGSALAVRNPTIKPVFDIIDYAQKKGTVNTINLPAVMSATAQFKSGGYTSTMSGNASGASVPMFSGKDIETMSRFVQVMKDVVDKGVTGKWNLYDLEKVQDKKKSIEDSVGM